MHGQHGHVQHVSVSEQQVGQAAHLEVVHTLLPRCQKNTTPPTSTQGKSFETVLGPFVGHFFSFKPRVYSKNLLAILNSVGHPLCQRKNKKTLPQKFKH